MGEKAHRDLLLKLKALAVTQQLAKAHMKYHPVNVTMLRFSSRMKNIVYTGVEAYQFGVSFLMLFVFAFRGKVNFCSFGWFGLAHLLPTLLCGLRHFEGPSSSFVK
jgi:hypothetical protein